MQDVGYIIGVIAAIASGIFNNFGTVLQKKVVNDLTAGEKISRKLLMKPLWLVGLILQMVVGTLFFLIAYGAFIPEWGIGAALVPGLMAAGLIVLAVGSMRILKEKLKREELLGITLMIIAIVLLGFSELETRVTDIELENVGFLLRVIFFTIVLSGGAVFCEIYQRRGEKYRGIFYAVSSGCMFALSNFWVAPLTALLLIVFSGQFVLWFIVAAIILVLTNIIGIYKIQQAFQYGQAANLIPIQQMPIQVAPIFVFFTIFMLPPVRVYSLPFMITAITLIIVSSFLLAQRQAKLEDIK